MFALLPLFVHGAESAGKPGLIAVVSDAHHKVMYIAPQIGFRLNANESLHPSLAPAFTAEWSGSLTIIDAGAYTFHVDGSLVIDGQPVTRSTPLTAGDHELLLRYQRNPGPVCFQFKWESEFFKLEPVPARFLRHRDAPAGLDENLLRERGRSLYEDLNCSACHELHSVMQPELSRPSPDLSEIGTRSNANWIYSWLENPRTFAPDASMPSIPLTAKERQDLAAYLGEMKAADPPRKVGSGLGNGKDLFLQIGCAACHTSANLSLHGLGSKYNPNALTQYLLNPSKSDRSGRMPNLFYLNTHEAEDHSRMMQVDPENRMPFMFHNIKLEREGEADAIAHYLMESKNPAFETAAPVGDAEHGEQLLQEKGCLNCHAITPRADIRKKLIPKASEPTAIVQSQWKLLGPFDSSGRHSDVFEPERRLDLNGEYKGATGALRWVDQPDFTDGVVHALLDNRPNTMCFLYRTITVEEDLVGTIYVGSDDTISVFINGERVHEFDKPRGMPDKKDIVAIRLKKGVNTVLLKVGNEGAAYEFYYKLGDLFAPLTSHLLRTAFHANIQAGCLADNPQNAPDFKLSENDRVALVSFLKSVQEAPENTAAPTYKVEHALRSLRCTTCHVMFAEKPADGLPDYPPILSEAGSKLRPEWIAQVLTERRRIRPWMRTRMPDFAPAAVQEFSYGLGACSGESQESPLTAVVTDNAKIKAGLLLLGKSNGSADSLGCIACHDFRGQNSQGVRGPDMTEMHERLRFEWYKRWLRQPIRIQAGTAMPTFFGANPDDAAERKISNLWDVLSLGKGMPEPLGRDEDKSQVLTVTDKPVLIRTGMPDSSPRSIAVGLPGFLSYDFDASMCCVRYVWYGEFLDVTPLRTGMGARASIPLGKRIFTAANSSPLRFGDVSIEPKVKFRGYTLINGLPRMHYLIDDVDVWQEISTIPGKTALRYAYEVGPSDKQLWFIKTPDAVFESDAGDWDGDRLKLAPVPHGALKFTITLNFKEQK